MNHNHPTHIACAAFLLLFVAMAFGTSAQTPRPGIPIVRDTFKSPYEPVVRKTRPPSQPPTKESSPPPTNAALPGNEGGRRSLSHMMKRDEYARGRNTKVPIKHATKSAHGDFDVRVPDVVMTSFPNTLTTIQLRKSNDPDKQCHHAIHAYWNFDDATKPFVFRYDTRGSGLPSATVKMLLEQAYETWRSVVGANVLPPLKLEPYVIGHGVGIAHLHPSSAPIQRPLPAGTAEDDAEIQKIGSANRSRGPQTTAAFPVDDELEHRPGYRDGVNEISFSSVKNRYSASHPDHHRMLTASETHVWAHRETRQIAETDIVFRPWELGKFGWTSTTYPNADLSAPTSADFLSAATAAFGHVLGLHNSESHGHTTTGFMGVGDTSKIDLECGDIEAIKKIYGRK